MLFKIFHHLLNLNVGTTMLWTFQRTKCSSHNGVCVGARRSDNACGKGGVISAAMLHVKDKCNIKNKCFQFCKFLIRTKHAKNIFSRRQRHVRSVDVKTFISFIMGIRTIAVDGKHWKFAYKHQTLTKYIGETGVIKCIIIASKCKNTSRHGIHNIFSRSFHNNIAHKISWESA